MTPNKENYLTIIKGLSSVYVHKRISKMKDKNYTITDIYNIYPHILSYKGEVVSANLSFCITHMNIYIH